MPELTKITPIASLLEYSAACLPAAEGLALPDLLWIDTDNLLLDPSYQRGISRIGQRTIKKIIGQFDWMKFGALIVAKSGTDFAVIDGRARELVRLIGGNKKTHFTGQLVKALNKILPNKVPEKTK